MAKRKPSRAARPARSARRGSKARPVRREPETLRLRAIEPALTVDDINRSLTFYTDVLGFFVSDRFTDKSGLLLGAMLKAGACGLNLSQDDWSKGRDRQKARGSACGSTPCRTSTRWRSGSPRPAGVSPRGRRARSGAGEA
jgi:Glyoxalase/Bleomycin resistance protein/Dioxygenase superfamily